MLRGRPYTVSIGTPTSVSVSTDCFEIQPADDKPIYIHEICLYQTSDLGDAAEEILQLTVQRGYTSSGSGGTSGTVAKGNPADTSAGFTSEVRNTTLATTGTAEILHDDGWNVRVPYIWTPTEEWRPFCSQAQTLIVVRISAPADAITIGGSIKVEEMG